MIRKILTSSVAFVALLALMAVTAPSSAQFGPVPGGTAAQVSVDAAGFSGNLSAADDTVQKALVTIDTMTTGGSTTMFVDSSSLTWTTSATEVIANVSTLYLEPYFVKRGGDIAVGGNYSWTGNHTIDGTLGITGAVTINNTLYNIGNWRKFMGRQDMHENPNLEAVSDYLQKDFKFYDYAGSLKSAAEIYITCIANSPYVSSSMSLRTNSPVTGNMVTAFIINDSHNVSISATDSAGTSYKHAVNGAQKVAGRQDVGGAQSVAGAATFDSTLGVTGETNLNGGLKMDTDKFTVADGTGNTAIAGTLTTAGVSRFSSEVAFDSALSAYLPTSGGYAEGLRLIHPTGGFLHARTAGTGNYMRPFIAALNTDPGTGANEGTGLFFNSRIGNEHANHAAYEFVAYRPDGAGVVTTADLFRIRNYDAIVARINSSGNLTLGATDLASTTAKLYVQGAAKVGNGALDINTFAANSGAYDITFNKSRNATEGSHTIVQSGDSLGYMLFAGSNGSSFDTAAYIGSFVDGTPGASADMPGRLDFYTTPDGSATPAVRMKINNAGNVTIGATDLASTTSKLYVNGNLKAGGSTSADSTPLFLISQASAPTVIRQRFTGKDFAGSLVDYAIINVSPVSNTPGAHSAKLSLAPANGGSTPAAFYINDSSNVTIGASDLASTAVKQHVEGLIRSGGTIAGTASAGSSGFASKVYAYADGASLPTPASGYMNEVWWTKSTGKLAKIAIESDGTTHEVYLEP